MLIVLLQIFSAIAHLLFGSVSSFMFEASIIHAAEAVPEVSLVSYQHIPATLISPPVHKDLSKVHEIRFGGAEYALIALTFDDGLDPEVSREMLDVLRDKHVPATFFLHGRFISEEPEIVKTIIADGHELGNHSYNHPNFTKIGTKKMKQEVQSQEDLLINEFHYSPKPYFRFPYGARTQGVLKLINQLGYTAISWNVDTLDWKSSKEHIVNEALTKAQNGAIIIMHLGKKETGKALPEIIDGLRAKGFALVTISTLLDYDSNLPNASTSETK